MKIKHDCTVGARCKKFKIISYSMFVGKWDEGKYHCVSERHTLEGEKESVERFFQDIRKDKRVTNLEISGNTMFFVSRSEKRTVGSLFSQKMFFTKPVFVDKEGYELWEIGSYDRNVLVNFSGDLKKENFEYFEILSFRNTKLDNVYFPAVAPELTEKQKRAFDLAVGEGYYDIPKRTELKKLARLMGISLATYQEHLKRAEAKVIPKVKTG